MRLPRDVSGAELLAALRRLGYEAVRQRGSHVRITTQVNGEHHEVIPQHNPIKTRGQPPPPLPRLQALLCRLAQRRTGALGGAAAEALGGHQ